MEIDRYIIPFIILSSGVILGFIFEKIVLKKLSKFALTTKWKGDDIFISSFRGILLVWGITGGIYFFFQSIRIEESIKVVIDKIVYSILVLSVSVVIARTINGLMHFQGAGGNGSTPATSIVSNIIHITAFLLGGLLILQTFGISVTPILTALGVGGLAIALALQGTLSNLFSGIQIITSQQIRKGDYIKLDSGEEGYVVDIAWRFTSIKTLPNQVITIPNSKLSSVIITNYNLPDKENAVLINVGVSYDSNLEKVELLTNETAKEVLRNMEGGVRTFDPFIRFHTFSDSSINFTVILRAREFVDQYLLKHEFVKALHKCYHENNIEIPFPIRTIHIKQKQ